MARPLFVRSKLCSCSTQCLLNMLGVAKALLVLLLLLLLPTVPNVWQRSVLCSRLLPPAAGMSSRLVPHRLPLQRPVERRTVGSKLLMLRLEYREGFRFWPVLVIFYKLLAATASIGLQTMPRVQSGTLVVLHSAFLAATTLSRPYRSVADAWDDEDRDNRSPSTLQERHATLLTLLMTAQGFARDAVPGGGVLSTLD